MATLTLPIDQTLDFLSLFTEEFISNVETNKIVSLTVENTLINLLYQSLHTKQAHRSHIIEKMSDHLAEVRGDLEKTKRENAKIQE
jgi:hypothetical protein